MFQKFCRENQNTYFMFNNFFFQKSCHLRDSMEKECKAGQATDDYTAHGYLRLQTHPQNM
jgi:hypothetical protein